MQSWIDVQKNKPPFLVQVTRLLGSWDKALYWATHSTLPLDDSLYATLSLLLSVKGLNWLAFIHMGLNYCPIKVDSPLHQNPIKKHGNLFNRVLLAAIFRLKLFPVKHFLATSFQLSLFQISPFSWTKLFFSLRIEIY